MYGTYVGERAGSPGCSQGQGYAVFDVSFGRRLALFFILIALVPTLVLVGMLVNISEDSRRGKADARLASGLETSLAVYEGELAQASEVVSRLAADPRLALAVVGPNGPDRAALRRFVRTAVAMPDVVAVQVVGVGDAPLAAAGPDDAIAFAELGLLRDGARNANLRVSTQSAGEFAAEVQRLTKRELVLTRGADVLTATVTPPAMTVEPNQTVDLELSQGAFRARMVELARDGGDELLLLGPRKEGGFLAIGGPALALLVGFLLLGVILAYRIAHSLTGLHEKVAEQAVKDPLTGLWNRRRMFEMLERELLRARRFGHEVSFLILDIDNFKSINDEMGHPQGDEVLRKIAEIVLKTTRTIDVGARYGGDELALVLLETDPEGAMILAERMRDRIHDAEVPRSGGGSMSVTVSVGAATTTEELYDLDALIEAADQALLEAKRTGKNRVRAAGA
ncbi:hypothetical protein BH20ACT15_BH20ACT15_13310 [soil metagenome]